MSEVATTRRRGSCKRVKAFEEDDCRARDRDPLADQRQADAGCVFKSKDGEVMIYKVIANRKTEESEIEICLATARSAPGRVPLEGRRGL